MVDGQQAHLAAASLNQTVGDWAGNERRIREVIATNAEGALEAHDIRTRQAGPVTFIDFHLVVPGTMSVEQAHTICDEIEARLREAVPDVQITIHVEPENKAKHSGIVVV